MRRGNNCAFPPLGNAMLRKMKETKRLLQGASSVYALNYIFGHIRTWELVIRPPQSKKSLLIIFKCGRWQCLPQLIYCYEAVKRYSFFSRYCSLDFKGWKFTYWLKAQLRHLRCLPRTFEVSHMRVHIDCDFMMSVSGYKVWIDKFINFFTIRRVFRKCKTSSRSTCSTVLGLSVIVLRRRRRK